MSTQRLANAGISTARLDALILMEDVLGIDRSQILAHPERAINSAITKKVSGLILRRANYEPLAYIRNKSEFYGREFYIDHHVLQPRPESEVMINLLKALPLTSSSRIIDVGTGSGALAITAALELPQTRVIAIDIDPACLSIAKSNSVQHNTIIEFIQSDLLDTVASERLSRAILLCNLPYVPDNFQISPAAMKEPRLAIFGGPDGLELYRRLFQQLGNTTCQPAYMLTEAMPPQHSELQNIATNAGFVLETTHDFVQVFRMGSEGSAL